MPTVVVDGYSVNYSIRNGSMILQEKQNPNAGDIGNQNVSPSSCGIGSITDINCWIKGLTEDLKKKILKEFYEKLFPATLGKYDGVYKNGSVTYCIYGTLGYPGSSVSSGIKTKDFVDFLIENKLGVVVEAPAVVNYNHSWAAGSVSLFQAWIWIPPIHITEKRILSGTEGIHNMPDEENSLVALEDKYPYANQEFTKQFGQESWGKVRRFAKVRASWNKRRKIKVLDNPGELS